MSGRGTWLVQGALEVGPPEEEGLENPGLDTGPTEVDMGDVNGDGNIDLVSVGDHGSPFVGSGQHGVMVWVGDGIWVGNCTSGSAATARPPARWSSKRAARTI